MPIVPIVSRMDGGKKGRVDITGWEGIGYECVVGWGPFSPDLPIRGALLHISVSEPTSVAGTVLLE